MAKGFEYSFVRVFILKGLPIDRPEAAEQYKCGLYNMDIFFSVIIHETT